MAINPFTPGNGIEPNYLAGRKEYLDQFTNFMTLGRRGLFNYNNQDHCMDMAFKASEHIINNGPVEQWKETRKKFDDYVIID